MTDDVLSRRKELYDRFRECSNVPGEMIRISSEPARVFGKGEAVRVVRGQPDTVRSPKVVVFNSHNE